MEYSYLAADHFGAHVFRCRKQDLVSPAVRAQIGSPVCRSAVFSKHVGSRKHTILFWDHDGFCIWYKRLERGTFQLLTTTRDQEGSELDYSQLVKLLGGLDLRTGRWRRRYRRSG
jgi:hypothetical protein